MASVLRSAWPIQSVPATFLDLSTRRQAHDRMGTWENVPGRISKAHVVLVALLPWTCGILPCFASPRPARARPRQPRTVLPFFGHVARRRVYDARVCLRVSMLRPGNAY